MRTAIAACAAWAWMVLSLAAAPPAGAGFLLTFSGASDSQTPARMSIEKEALRIEEGGNVAIYRRDKNLLWSLNSREKTYTELTHQQAEKVGKDMGKAMEGLREQMKDLSPEERKLMEGMMGEALKKHSAPSKVEYRKIASNARAGKWTCDRYEMLVDGRKKAETCFARAASIGVDPPEAQTLESFFAFMSKTAKQMGAVFGVFQGSEPPGIPVETVSFSEDKASERMEVQEIARKSFPGSLFEVPEGYRKEEMGPGR
ncbi:MAG: DUF4412 domain-containing protein [Candidatus Tectomicrobia bacterium]|uniref:DUF4412 domain-containing protein n=1 Tax=Tectimicrobiota bacterium TaxID=2528274 RepID=A0A932MM64_UNCTE|nr:DUF4412 domain-containing protein [Candidatus Tectomicrobia bacterium]